MPPAVDDVIAGRKNDSVERDPHGREFKFFIGTVLTRGVPAQVRTAFEQAMAALPPGQLDPAQVARLQHEYPRIADAYSPQQWASAFASRGLEARAFGATWR